MEHVQSMEIIILNDKIFVKYKKLLPVLQALYCRLFSEM